MWDLQPEPRAYRGDSQPGTAASAGSGAEGAGGAEGTECKESKEGKEGKGDTEGKEGGSGEAGGGVGVPVPCCTHTLPHDGMVYAVAMGEGYVLGGTVERVIVWQSRNRAPN